MKRIPTLGLVGELALREAAAGSYQQIMLLIETKLRQALQLAGDQNAWAYVTALFPDSVVVQSKEKLWRYPYSIKDSTEVELGEPVEVVETYVPAAGAGAMRESAPSGAFLEAVGEKGAARWRIRVIRAGLSGNGNFYPDAVLREAVKLFAGARVFVKSDEEHLAGKGKDVRNLVGRLSDPAFVEGRAPDMGEIQATLELLQPEGDVAVKLREAWDRGMASLFGFSIDAAGAARTKSAGGRKIRAATAIRKVNSVDLIVEPGAGGEVIKLLEAQSEEDPDMKLRERMLKLIEAKRPDLFKNGLLKDRKPDELDDDELEAIYTEALSAPVDKGPRNEPGDKPGDAVTRDELDATVRMVEARAHVRTALAGSGLPDAARTRLQAQFDGLTRFTEAQVDEAIQAEREYLAPFTESGRVAGLGDGVRLMAGESRAEKVAAMLDAFFDPAHKDHRHAQSFRECYIQITGDARVTGQTRNCDEALLRESLQSGSFDDVLGDSITRRMVADYRTPSIYDVWRLLTGTPVPINDFRTNERTRFGGYGDLPAVGQGQPYQAMGSPTDEKATYAVTKRGGTEDVTLEMIKNDDVGAIRRIPIKLSRAGKRTLAKFVLDFIKDNPAIYDGVALFHASHNNLGSTALASAALAAARLSMLKQTELDSGDRLGIGPKYLWVAPDGEEDAVDLFRRNTENDKTFIQSLSLQVVPVWYWTDTNDWAVSADPMDIPTVEIGFLDGEEEPALFVQDSPTVGSMFSHDKLTWKIRHIYGGNVLDYRGLFKAVVA